MHIKKFIKLKLIYLFLSRFPPEQWNHVATVEKLQPRTSNNAEIFNSCLNRTGASNAGFWRVVDVLHLYATVVEKEIGQVQAGTVPEKNNQNDCRGALEKMKKIRAITRFNMGVEEKLLALAKHSDTDWTGRELDFTTKRFDDADAAMTVDGAIETMDVDE